MDAALGDPHRRVVGTRQILRALAQDRLGMVYLAKDADERVGKQLKEACLSAGMAYDETATMQELGKACRIAVGAAAAGLLKPQ